MNAYIVAGYRSAITKAKKGRFRNTRPDDIASKVIKYLIKQIKGLDPRRVEDLIVGTAIPEAEQGMQIGRMISLLSMPVNVPGMVVNRFCASGLEAIAIAATRIHSGMANCIIAGGVESMSMLPITGYKPALNWTISSTHPEYYLSMGLTAEELAKEYNITREESDTFAFHSHKKAFSAIQADKFKEEIVPITVSETVLNEEGKKETKSHNINLDEGPRPDTTIERLAKLKPAFKIDGQITAGNSSQISDGAAFVIVMSEKMLKDLNIDPIARLMSYSTTGVDPRIMGIGPAYAVPKALAKAGLQPKDIDQIELNEAFSAQSLAVIKALDLDLEKVNINGGAIALGHPLGCTGAKLSIQILNEMKRRKQKYGLVTACVGGGQGVAGIYELLK